MAKILRDIQIMQRLACTTIGYWPVAAHGSVNAALRPLETAIHRLVQVAISLVGVGCRLAVCAMAWQGLAVQRRRSADHQMDD